MVRIILLLALVVLTGCSHTIQIGKLPSLYEGGLQDWVPMKTSAISLLGPSVTVVYKFNKRTGETAPLEGVNAAGNGIAGNVVGGAAYVVGMKYLKDGLKDSGDQTTVNQSGGGANASSVADAKARSNAHSESRITAPPPPNPPLPPTIRQRPPGHYRPPKDWRN